MNRVLRFVNVLLACGLYVTPVATAEEEKKEEEAFPHAAGYRDAIRVVDLTIVSTNRVTIGTNTMSLKAATNLIASHRDAADVVAVHGLAGGDDPSDTQAAAVAKIARIGMPLVVVEKDGAYAWRKQSDSDGIRTLKLGTDQFATLQRLWKRRKPNAEASTEPTLQTTVQWDTATGNYELSRVELGLFGRHVWLMHEQRDSDDESDSVGIQLKKTW